MRNMAQIGDIKNAVMRGTVLAHQPGTGAVREGAALLQGLATCGQCGRHLAVYYSGPTKSTPGYYCTGTGELVDGRGLRHLHVGGAAIDHAVADAFLAALAPTALQACLTAAQRLEDDHDAVLTQWRRQVEQAGFKASKAERRYRAVDPDNRLVARSLESEWEHALTDLATARTELARREAARPATLTPQEKATILALGDDLGQVWSAPTTTDKDRKQLLRTLVEEVAITVHRDTVSSCAGLVVRWKGGAITEITVALKRKPPAIRTSEDTVDLLRRLAVHYSDAVIAGILNRQHRTTARGLEFTASRVQSLRYHWGIDCHQSDGHDTEGDVVTVADAAKNLGVAASTLHRWLSDGFIAGEQVTPGAPWRIRLTQQLRDLFVDAAPAGWVVMQDATTALGVTRQTIMQRVKNGQLEAVHVRSGRRKGLRIHIPDTPDTLF